MNNGLNPSICPYCGGENTEQIDFDWDNASAKHICRDCNQDYIAWYDDTTEECYEITDRHNKMIKRTEQGIDKDFEEMVTGVNNDNCESI